MTSRPGYLPAEERRAGIVDAVLELAAEHNPADITTAAIARQMTLTQGALFRHFPSKEAIWEAVMVRVSDRLLAKVDQAIAAGDSPLRTLEAVFLAHVDFVVIRPGVPRLLFGELQRAGSTPAKRIVCGLMSHYGQRLHSLIEAGKQAGEVAEEVDAGVAATMFIGTIQGLVMRSLFADNVANMRLDAPLTFAIYRRGIAATR